MKKLLLYLLHSAYLALTAEPVVLYAAASAGAPAWPAMLLLCGASAARSLRCSRPALRRRAPRCCPSFPGACCSPR